jgi:hypothetical protein
MTLVSSGRERLPTQTLQHWTGGWRPVRRSPTQYYLTSGRSLPRRRYRHQSSPCQACHPLRLHLASYGGVRLRSRPQKRRSSSGQR